MDLIALFRNEPNVSDYAAGDEIFTEGEPGDSMFVILEGEVELSVRGIPIDTIVPGEMFGEMALIDSRDRSATARAKSSVKLVGLNEDRFSFLVQQTPHFALVVMRILVSRLREMDDTLG